VEEKELRKKRKKERKKKEKKEKENKLQETIEEEQRQKLVTDEALKNNDAPLNMVNLWDRLKENHDQVDMSIKERLMSFLNFGVLKKKAREMVSIEIKVVTQEFKEK
jgi:hypothetical protein